MVSKSLINLPAHGPLQMTDVFGVSTAGSLEMDQAPLSALPALFPRLGVVNEWPDPQICVADLGGLVNAMNDTLTGTLSAISVSSYTTGSQTVVCSTTNTTGLLVGTLGIFSAAADPALKAGPCCRVTAIVANTSFTVVLDFTSGTPSSSAACTFQPVMKGDLTGANGGDVTSQIGKSASTKVWISDRPAHTSLLVGCSRVLVVQKATSGAEFIFLQPAVLPFAALTNQNRAVGMACVVANGTGATAQCYINNGAFQIGGVIATANSRTWIGQQINCGTPTFYQIGVALLGPVGSTYVFGEFTEGVSSTVLPDGSFYTPKGQFIRFKTTFSPWNGAQFTFPGGGNFEVDAQQFSAGAIMAGVSTLCGLLEGQCQNNSPTAFSTNDQFPGGGSNVTYNPIVHQQLSASGHAGVPAYYGFCGGNFNLSAGQPYFQTAGASGDQWKYVSFDIHGAFVNVVNG